MKTTPNLMRSVAGIIVSGFFAAAALAGPGPQFWNRPAAKPAPKPDATTTAKCEGCKTTPIWAPSDRSPAGKGAPSARVIGTKHECGRCAGTLTREHGKMKDGMTRDAACVPIGCCK